jgi:tetratricopeptide (TPR) repeat protein
MKRKILSLILGLIIISIGLELSMRLGGLIFKFSQDQKNKISLINNQNGKKTLTILVLGESTTAVAANDDNTMLTQENAYPYFLEKYLNEKNLPFNFKVINKGIMGGETGIILDTLENYLYTDKADIIVAMMGMKDTAFTPRTTRTNYIFKQLIDYVSQNSRLVNYISSLYTQAKLKQNGRILQKDVRLFVDLSREFIENNQRIMGIDIGINSALNPKMEERDVRDLAKQEFLAIYFFRTGQMKRANKIFEVLKTKFKFGHLVQAILLEEKNELNAAEEVLKEHLKLYPTSNFTYKELVSLYIDSNQIAKAQNLLKEAKKLKLSEELNIKLAEASFHKISKNYNAGISILKPKCYVDIPHDFNESSKKNIIHFSQKFTQDDIFKECIYNLSEFYFNNKNFKLAEETIQRFVNNSNSISGYNLLRKIYEKLGKIGQSEDMYQQLLSRNKRVGEYYALADFYRNSNNQIEAETIYDDIASSFPQTTKNFKKLHTLSRAVGAKLLIMQYPTFSIDPLKKLSGNLEGAIYVSNETIFNNGPRTDYFYEPHYPYNFNHYTKLGSQTIAKNLANEIASLVK